MYLSSNCDTLFLYLHSPSDARLPSRCSLTQFIQFIVGQHKYYFLHGRWVFETGTQRVSKFSGFGDEYGAPFGVNGGILRWRHEDILEPWNWQIVAKYGERRQSSEVHSVMKNQAVWKTIWTAMKGLHWNLADSKFDRNHASYFWRLTPRLPHLEISSFYKPKAFQQKCFGALASPMILLHRTVCDILNARMPHILRHGIFCNFN